jgi:hypothetical protein
MSRKTINFPQPVIVEYDDTEFYTMIDAYDYPQFTETEVNQIIDNAPNYIRVSGFDFGDKPVPMLYEDIVLQCQRVIVRELIAKYQS